MGIASETVRVGDLIIMFAGLRVPFVVSDVGNGFYCLMAPAYVEEMMGEELWDENGWLDEFILV
jgi:hypothetical protein